jgi:hypothetical protein
MTLEDIQKEFIMERLADNPEFRLEDLEKNASASDEEWMNLQIAEGIDSSLKDIFEGKVKPVAERPKTPTDGRLRPSGMSPVEAARQRATAKARLQARAVADNTLGSDYEFEEVVKDTNELKPDK